MLNTNISKFPTFLQKLMDVEKLSERGEFEEIRLSDDDYDATKSTLTITCLTQKENQWKPYLHYKLQRVR